MLRSLSLCLLSLMVGAARAEPPARATRDKELAAAAADVDRLWSDLAGPDAARAYQAVWALARLPEQTPPYIDGKLKPALAPDPRSVETWIANLSSDTFSVREKANRELAQLGGLAWPALSKASKTNSSLETRQRVDKLLNRLLAPLTLPDHLRAVRAVEVLEQLGTDGANKLLAKYAGGAPGARLTQDAQEALARLGKAERFTLPRSPSGHDIYGDPLPAAALGRLGTVRFRRASYGLAGLAFVPGRQELVTAGDHQVQVWEVPGGRLLRQHSTATLAIGGFALAPDGKRFAVGGSYPRIGAEAGSSEIRIYDFPSGTLAQTLPRERPVYSWALLFSADGKLLFSLNSHEGILRIEEVSSGKELSRRKFPTDNGGGLALSSDGTYLAIASGVNSRKLFLWKWRDEEPQALELRGYGLENISFAPRGDLLAGLDNLYKLLVWEVPGGRLLYHQEAADKDFFQWGSPTFTPDGKVLAIPLRHRRGSGQGRILLLDPATGRAQGVLATSGVGDKLAVSGDSRTLAAPAGMGMRLWDLASRQELAANDQVHESAPSHIVVSSKGFLVTASEQDQTVRSWDAATTKQLQRFAVERMIDDISLSPDSKLLAAASSPDVVQVWDVSAGRPIYRLDGHSRRTGRQTLGFLANGRDLLSFGGNFFLRRWDMKTGKARFEYAIRPQGLKIPDEDVDDAAARARAEDILLFRLGAAALTPDRRLLVLPAAKSFHLFDADTGKPTFKFPGELDYGGFLTISPNSKYLLASARGSYEEGKHAVSLIDLASGATMQRHLLPGSNGTPVAFSKDGRMFATAVDGLANDILVYEAASGHLRGELRGLHGNIRSLAFLPDSRALASGHVDSTVLLWDLRKLENPGKGP